MIFVMNQEGNEIKEVYQNVELCLTTANYMIMVGGKRIARFDFTNPHVEKYGDGFYMQDMDGTMTSIDEHKFKQIIKESDEHNMFQKSLAEAVFVELVDTINEKLQKNEGGVIYIDRIIRSEQEFLEAEKSEE